MTEHRCPQDIFRMFDEERTKPGGRRAAIDWLKQQDVRPGDVVWIPDADTGEAVSFTKEAAVS